MSNGLSLATTRKLNEWVTWYNWNADKIGQQPVETQVKWLLKAVSGAYEAMSMIGNDVNANKVRRAQNMSNGGIILPRGFSWEKRNGA